MATIPRYVWVDMAKVIRNTPIAKTSRIAIVRGFIKAFKRDNPVFDEDSFRKIALSGSTGDYDAEV